MKSENFFEVSLLRALITLPFFVIHPLAADDDVRLAFLKSHAVRIEVRNVNPEVASSGFLWKQNDLVVTSLHAIPASLHANPPVGAIIVKCGNLAKRADVLKVLPKADLVLLKVRGPLHSCTPFTAINENDPGTMPTLHTYGWHGNAGIGQPKKLHRGDGGPLKGLLGEGVILDAIAQFGTPSPIEKIYAMSNGSLPGYSGAAIINENHQLIAIVDGGLNNSSAGYTWAIPSRYLLELDKQDAGVTWTRPASPIPEWLYSIALADPGDKAVVPPYQEIDPWTDTVFEYEWVHVKSLNIRELAKSADDPGELLNLYYAYGSDIDPDSLVFDIYEDQHDQEDQRHQQLIIAIPSGQELIREEVDGNPGYNWLKSEAPDGNSGHAQYKQSKWPVTTAKEPFALLDPSDSRFFNEKISELLAECNEPGQSTCTVDPDSIRIVRFDNGAKILRVGFGLNYEPRGVGYGYAYDYYSIAVRGNVAFRAFLTFWNDGNQGPGPCAQDPNRVCANPNASQLAQMMAIQLTTYANLGSTTGGRTLETRFNYDASADNPDTIRAGFYQDGKLRFYNSRGGIWLRYTYHATDLTEDEHYETSRDGEYVYLTDALGSDLVSVRVPIRGGEYYALQQGQWLSSGFLQRQ